MILVMSSEEKPLINDTRFGSITVDGKSYDHDIIITLKGEVKKRKKKLSKSIYGTSHTVSLPEIRYVYQENAEGLIFGSGQYGVASLSPEAAEFLSGMKCGLVVKSTPEAMQEWNRQKGKWIGLFHITC
jgi:hypothetical protein